MISIEFLETAALHIKLDQLQHQQQVGQQAVEKQLQETEGKLKEVKEGLETLGEEMKGVTKKLNEEKEVKEEIQAAKCEQEANETTKEVANNNKPPKPNPVSAC